MNSWIPKTNTIIVASSLLLISVLIYGVSLLVINNKINAIELAYSNTANILAVEEEARGLKVVADENRERIDFVNKFFVEKGDEVVFIEDIERLARSIGIKFNIVSISPVKPISDDVESKEISIKMNIDGSWNNIMKFLDGLEKLPFGVSIQNFSLDKPSGSSWTGSIDFLVFN